MLAPSVCIQKAFAVDLMLCLVLTWLMTWALYSAILRARTSDTGVVLLNQAQIVHLRSPACVASGWQTAWRRWWAATWRRSWRAAEQRR